MGQRGSRECAGVILDQPFFYQPFFVGDSVSRDDGVLHDLCRNGADELLRYLKSDC